MLRKLQRIFSGMTIALSSSVDRKTRRSEGAGKLGGGLDEVSSKFWSWVNLYAKGSTL
jgi:hypothetical protein